MSYLLTPEEYQTLRQQIDHYDSEARRRFSTRGGWVSIPADQQDTLPPDPGNEARGRVELYEFCTERPTSYFAYVNTLTNQLTTWVGNVLGSVSMGREYRDNFGGVRVPITVNGVNGLTYHGTYFKSAGDYARIKAHKRQNA
jgi:hypothetical protein